MEAPKPTQYTEIPTKHRIHMSFLEKFARTLSRNVVIADIGLFFINLTKFESKTSQCWSSVVRAKMKENTFSFEAWGDYTFRKRLSQWKLRKGYSRSSRRAPGYCRNGSRNSENKVLGMPNPILRMRSNVSHIELQFEFCCPDFWVEVWKVNLGRWISPGWLFLEASFAGKKNTQSNFWPKNSGPKIRRLISHPEGPARHLDASQQKFRARKPTN